MDHQPYVLWETLAGTLYSTCYDVSESALALTSLCFQFAKQAKKIITRPVVNEANDDGLLSKYLREIERLKQELEVSALQLVGVSTTLSFSERA